MSFKGYVLIKTHNGVQYYFNGMRVISAKKITVSWIRVPNKGENISVPILILATQEACSDCIKDLYTLEGPASIVVHDIKVQPV